MAISNVAGLFVPIGTLKYAYNAIVQPHFDCCDAVRGNCNTTLPSKFQKLQSRAARILTFSSYDTNADLLLDKFSWGKLADRRRSHIATMIYKSLHNVAPDSLRAKFVDRDSVTSYALRHIANKLAVPQPHTNCLKNSFRRSAGAIL